MRDKVSYSEAGKLGAIAAAETIALKKAQRIEDWNRNPKLCQFCATPIVYDKRQNDFCNHTCSANFHNQAKGYTLVSDKINVCSFCKNEFKPITGNENKYCSRQCMMDFWWQETKTQLISSGVDSSSANHIGKKYLIELHGGACQICKETEWQGKPMPLVLDHINGNPYDNSLENLRVICHNCNAQLPTFAGRNKGNGRIARAKRYIVEKEVIKKMKADIV